MSNSIDILGTKYQLFRLDSSDQLFNDGIYGRCDSYLKKIFIRSLNQTSLNLTKPKQWFYLNELEALHHEIIHAYLNECGLKYNTYSSVAWSQNEEMIDWIACMTEKIANTFKQADQWLGTYFN